MKPLLQIKDAHVAYGRVDAVRDVNLTVETGQIVAVIGANGAGKTTLLNGIMGLLPLRGEVRFQGNLINDLDVEDRVQLGISLVAERRELFSEMSVQDNLLLGAYLKRGDAQLQSRFDAIFRLFPRLSERRNQYAQTLSGGERQMLALARALMGSPTMLLLDEPSLGLAPLIVRDVFRTIKALRSTGISILLIEQNARAALECADYGYVLDTGELALQGDPSTLLSDPNVIATYLGSGSVA